MTDRCDDLIPALLRAADGTLPAGEQARLDAHLATCAACAEALADQRAMRGVLAATASTPVVTHVGARVMATLREEARTAAPAASWLDVLDWRRWTWRLAPLAAALALAVAGVSRTDAQAITPETVSEDTGAQPVSTALFSGDVSGADLLTLLLNASADQALATTAQEGVK